MEVHKYVSSRWVWFLILIDYNFCLYTEGKRKGNSLIFILSFHLKQRREMEVESDCSSMVFRTLVLEDATFYL